MSDGVEVASDPGALAIRRGIPCGEVSHNDPSRGAEPSRTGAEGVRDIGPAERWRNPLRRCYDWVLSWAETPYGGVALFVLAFAEASCFPIPPDVLLIALVLGARAKWWRYALSCTIASVLGGCFGYYLGTLGEPFAREFLTATIAATGDGTGSMASGAWWALPLGVRVPLAKYQQVLGYFAGDHGLLWLAISAFTPIPFKVFTIVSGAVRLDLVPFVLVALFGRGARFFLVAALLSRFGEPCRRFIDRWFNWLALLFGILLIGGFWAIGRAG